MAGIGDSRLPARKVSCLRVTALPRQLPREVPEN
jgi:hypothetical protein